MQPGTRLAVMATAGALLAYAARTAVLMFPHTVRGALFWLLLGAFVLALLSSIRHLLCWCSLALGRERTWGGVLNLMLVIASGMLGCVLLEMALGWTAPAPPGPGQAGAVQPVAVALPAGELARITDDHRRGVLPAAWLPNPVVVPGTSRALTWHGVLHVFDRNGFRRQDGPFPERRPDVARILVVGDSLTYGQGVDVAWTLPAQLERLLARAHRVEVINLGVTGAQSADIARALREHAPGLRPDIIVYAMFLNDFLPSGPARDHGIARWLLPDWIRDSAYERTRLAWQAHDALQALMIRLGYAPDIWDDVLEDIDANQRRFSIDLRDMRETARALGLAEIFAIVLDYLPDATGRGQALARRATTAMEEVGVAVIPAEGALAPLGPFPRTVSRWEFHPNAAVYTAFATRIADHLRERPELRAYRNATPP